MTTTTLRLPPRLARLPQLRQIVRGGLAARGSLGAGLAAKAGGAAANGLLNSLIAYWPGNEASGNALDAHTNTLHLSDENTVTNAAGKVYSTARQYTLSNSERHTIADNASLSAGDIDLTLAAWVYLDSKPATAMQIFGKGSNILGKLSYGISWVTGTDRFRFVIDDGTLAVPTVLANTFGAPSLSTWYLVVGSRIAGGSAKISIQINNGTIDELATAIVPYDDPYGFAIGAWSDTSGTVQRYWNGRIGPVAMWKSAAGGGGVLTAAQRTALWNGGNGLTYSAFTT